MRICVLTVLCVGVIGTDAKCPAGALGPLPYVLEHALWRGWHQAIIYTPQLEPGCHWAVVRLIKCLAVNGVASVVSSNPAIARVTSKLGIAILMPPMKPNSTDSLTKFIKKLSELEMDTGSYDWLLTVRSENEFKYVNEILNASSIRFDQNILVAFTFTNKARVADSIGLCDSNFIYKVNNVNNKLANNFNRRNTYSYGRRYYKSYNSNCQYGSRDPSCIKTEYERNYYRTTERFRNLTKSKTYKKAARELTLFQSGIINYNYSRPFKMINVSKISLRNEIAKLSKVNRFYGYQQGVYLVQYFKVRTNSTLYAYLLGGWSIELSMSLVEAPYPVEVRTFVGEVLTVGRCNSTGDGAAPGEDDGLAAPVSMDDVLHFLTFHLNSTPVIRYYSKLGFRTYEGAWTGLLGAMLARSVDVALEPVTAHAQRHHDMDFIFPIAETMCNIYIRHQETSTVRDIFLAPFSPRLVVCVMAVAVVAALAVVLISRLTPSLRAQPRSMGYTEALIWSTGILCQQGGTWTPPNSAASVLLIVCLLFAVVTYNAYAAFITSVLSVRVASLDTVAALLNSPEFKIGYIRNGADQMYLMSTKDAQLNAFYIRGYSDAENLVSSAEEGLARAASQNYAFFAGQRAARNTLRSLSQARGRCAVRELPVHSTRAHLAFPLPPRSPYARPILVGLLQLRSSGVLERLESALVPAMPQCTPPPGFASARAADVRSALILLLVGLVTALLIVT